ncbi:DUF6114 domain-containing protein [Kitasatospora sp. NBC_00374]|uniref:DUF6114 domain-containing protein n=1 Tax=Kitasatospora sp. NBC_00374 TaxID=2975964 RepID=UPI0030E26301
MSSATAESWPEEAPAHARMRTSFRAWRRTRPFWGGLLAMLAGVPILYFPYAHLSLGGLTVSMATTAGAGSLIIGLLMIALGLTAWFQPLVRVFCGVATTILSLISIPVSNLGGFGFGVTPGLIAGGLLVAWTPLKPLPEDAAGEAQTAEQAAHDEPATAEEQPPAHAAAPAAVDPEEPR